MNNPTIVGDIDERIDLLDDATEHLAAAINCIQEAVAGTENEGLARAYIIAHLKNWQHSHELTSIASLKQDMLANKEEDLCPACDCELCNGLCPVCDSDKFRDADLYARTGEAVCPDCGAHLLANNTCPECDHCAC